MIGQRIKQERERLGLTQPQFAAIAGAAKRTVIDWQNGTSSPTAAQLAALANAGVDVLFVVTGKTKALQEALNDIRSTTEIATAIGGSSQQIALNQADLFKAIREARAVRGDEEELLDSYRRCDEDDQEVIRRMAQKLAAANSPEKKTTKSREKEK